MYQGRSLRRALLPAALAFASAFVPAPARAQWVVVDPSNLAQNIQQVLRTIDEINNQRMQITYQLQALRKLGNPSWRNIMPLVQQLDGLMQQGAALGYSIQALDAQFQQTFPGSSAAANNLLVPTAQRQQAVRALETMRAALDVLQWQSRNFQAGQQKLAAIKASMSGIQGTQQAIELQSTLSAFTGEEIGLLRQEVATQTNVQAVYNAYVIDREAQMQANYRAMMDRMSILPPPSARTFSLQVQP